MIDVRSIDDRRVLMIVNNMCMGLAWWEGWEFNDSETCLDATPHTCCILEFCKAGKHVHKKPLPDALVFANSATESCDTTTHGLALSARPK